jgi:hypothetical protein
MGCEFELVAEGEGCGELLLGSSEASGATRFATLYTLLGESHAAR